MTLTLNTATNGSTVDDATVDAAGDDDDYLTQSDVQARGQTKDEGGYYYRLSGDDVLRVWSGSSDEVFELDRDGGGDGTRHDDGSVSHELGDGTTITIAADNTISWQNADGTSGSDDSAAGGGSGETDAQGETGSVDFVDGGYVDFEPESDSSDEVAEAETDETEVDVDGGAEVDVDDAGAGAGAEQYQTTPQPIAAGGGPEGRYMEFADGSRLDIESDGDVTITGAAGDFTRIDALSGETASGQTLEDGTTVWRNGDGDWGVEAADGTAVRVDADGDRFVRDADGEIGWITADGLTGTFDPDAPGEPAAVPELSDPEFFEGVSEHSATLRGAALDEVWKPFAAPEIALPHAHPGAPFGRLFRPDADDGSVARTPFAGSTPPIEGGEAYPGGPTYLSREELESRSDITPPMLELGAFADIGAGTGTNDLGALVWTDEAGNEYLPLPEDEGLRAAW